MVLTDPFVLVAALHGLEGDVASAFHCTCISGNGDESAYAQTKGESETNLR